MKIKFNPYAGAILIVTTFFMNYKLIEVGVPDSIVLVITIAYAMLFPIRPFTVVTDEKE